ncbi:MAG: PLP-dependent aminotransferase family protein [Lachnotalea sp.]
MWIAIEKDTKLSLTRQIYIEIRKMIIEGTLTSGQKLPSTRQLSKELGISRNTALEVYNQMIAEGYLEARQGSGTIVSSGLQELKIPISELCNSKKESSSNNDTNIIDFCSGIPALELFPRKDWTKLYTQVCNNLPNEAYGYCDPCGVWELREAIAQYLLRSRGISCDPRRIMITSGSTQGLSLISTLLQKQNKKVLVENPSHPGLLKVIASTGCVIETIPADNQGLDTNLLSSTRDVSFVYTTPSHQYPLGSILSIQRRLSLVNFASENNCYIIEDDYDSEFRYEGQPISSLYELNPKHVIYIGSFSKILSPAIRLGFILLPEKLLLDYKTLKNYTDVHTEALTQYALASFIRTGQLEKHIWKMKKHYSRNRTHMLAELSKQFPDGFEILGHATGLHMVVHFHNVTFTTQLVEELANQDVLIYPIEHYLVGTKQDHGNEILMGYSHLSFPNITKGIQILRNVIGT